MFFDISPRWKKPRKGRDQVQCWWWFLWSWRSITTAANCFRDHHGQFILAWTAWKFAKHSTFEGEGAALFEAMRMASSKGFRRVIFRSDSQILVNAIYLNHQGSYEFSSNVSLVLFFFMSLHLNWIHMFISLRGRLFLELVTIVLSYFLLVLSTFWLMEWVKFVLIKKNKVSFPSEKIKKGK